MLRIFGWFTLSILILATALGFRKHFRSFVDNLKFKYSYNVAQMRAKDNMSKRLTQQAYIKGLKEGYALGLEQGLESGYNKGIVEKTNEIIFSLSHR